MLTGREAFIVDAVRTPVGRGHPEKGMLRDVHPADLLGPTYAGLVARSGIDPDRGRQRRRRLRVPDRRAVGGDHAQRRGCSRAARDDRRDDARHPLRLRPAGAASRGAARSRPGSTTWSWPPASSTWAASASRSTRRRRSSGGAAFTPELLERYDLVPQGEGAELIADQYGITARTMDELRRPSRTGARARPPTTARSPRDDADRGQRREPAADQGIRPDTTLESARPGLKPAFRADGRVTAGNSSQVSDGAAALLLMRGRRPRSSA